MTTLAPRTADLLLTGDVLAHLDAQLVGARRLLGIVLEQGAAIRRRDIQNVVRLAGMLQVEMQRRQLLEEERMRLLRRAGERLAISPESVTLTMLEGLMDPAHAGEARERTAELRGLLGEIQREHTVNRTLMTQELAFLDHLLRLTGSAGGYDAGGDHATNRSTTVINRQRVFDLEA
jgi:hypothetical protein